MKLKSIFKSALLAMIVAVGTISLNSCGGDEPDDPNNPGGGPDLPDVEATVVGQWIGYGNHEKLGDCRMDLTVNKNGTGENIWRNAASGTVEKHEYFRWKLMGKRLILTYCDSNWEGNYDDDELEVERLTSDALIVLAKETDSFAFIRKGREIQYTKSLIEGVWLVDYQWSESRMMWRYDRATLNANGTGEYVENAYRESFGGNTDTAPLKWSFANNTLTLSIRNGEYGYKPGEPEYETQDIHILLATKTLLLVEDDGEIITIVRQ